MAEKTKEKKLRTRTLRTAVGAVVFVGLSAGLVAGVSAGTLSGFGWDTFSLLCPLGALGTMIATKTMIPHAVVSLLIVAALVLLFGRAFCSWVCPTMLIDRVRDFFRSPVKRRALAEQKNTAIKAVSKQELEGLKAAKAGHTCGACGKCQPVHHGKLDSRHAVLGGALLSTAVFGFPVFCLVCPVGLTFATVLVVWRAFAHGDATIGLVLIPALLIVELVVLRKWCSNFCPLSALMNLVGRFSRTFVPVIDDEKCLETAHATSCSRCAEACEADINIRHPEFGLRTMADCTRCRNCVDACPTKAITMPVFVGKKAGKTVVEIPEPVMDDLEPKLD
ncbi:4Fe-4S binding protein [Adlercreutzia sp. R21]|uniref:4Fe-4S binding protein n=1 Tax=Adlercreutzia wanghongyangiae TaxID=3111451 RepID=UPI002DB9AC5A|nr:4Fe-4S binding protein [Adlercreutzia sp. R21]MEC4185191.1 4Fe-4S binding protein [Adlercreutzia sp. R21]